MTRASLILFWFSLTILVSLGLYHTSYRVEELGQNLRSLNRDIEAEQRSIHVLKAEYVYLSDPSRIEEVSRKHLDLQPTKPSQIVSLGKLRELTPTHREAMGGTIVKAAPIASLDPRTATHKPEAVASESEHINTRLVIRKAASAETAPKDHRSLAMVDTEDSSYNLVPPVGEEP